MGLLLVLLAVRLTFRAVRAAWLITLVHHWVGRVLVVLVAVTFLFGRETIRVELALGVCALERSSMCLFVFTKIAVTLEDFVTSGMGARVNDVAWLIRFPPTSHGAEDSLRVIFIIEGSLKGRNAFTAFSDGDHLSILLTNQF